MNYYIPQIQHESKIGGVTFPQFFSLAAGIAICFLLYFAFAGEILVIVPIIIVLSLTLILTFANVHGMSLPIFISKLISHKISGHRYVWQRRKIEISQTLPNIAPPVAPPKNKVTMVKRRGRITQLKQNF
ncbi:MAG TPA: hypothetical protein PKM84_00910 [Candidatus Pacearchaeota archaeon]|nr:hypothetical protein [Candidatus Pacearchaeota archaeon]